MRYKTGTLVTASLLILAATADIVRADAPQSGTAVAFAVSRPLSASRRRVVITVV